MQTTIVMLLAAGMLAATARGTDLVRESIPNVWLDPYLPEKQPDPRFPAYFDALDKARAMVFAGQYKKALITLQNIDRGDPAEIAMVRSAALAAIGRRPEALSVLSVPAIADHPEVQIERARLLCETGGLSQAIDLLKVHLEKNPRSLAGHYYLGYASELAGDLDAARRAYDWIYRTYYDQWQGQGARTFEDARQVTLMGRAFDRHAMLTGAYANNPEQHNTILRVFVQAYDIIDRDYWPARLAAAEYFWSHGNGKEAVTELEQVLARNPNEARARGLLAMIAMEQFNFDAAEAEINAIRAVDADSPIADLADARLLLQQRQPLQAEHPINRVLESQPENLEALGLLAASYALQLRHDQMKQVLARVEKIDPDNASAYFEIGEQLAGMRQYAQSEEMFQIAIDRAPWWMAPRNGLGLMLTQKGDEDKAKAVLDAAYSLDPFNYRTTNYLVLLDMMAKMDRRESDHFILIYDPLKDPILAEYVNDYMESVHGAISEAFRHVPPEKTLIEVFPTHAAFSVRTTGSPWIGTVGASTGRVLALVAPRRGVGDMRPYNWAQTLRHEYTHTVTLSATENRIAHWMTEGLAVYQEQSPMPWDWVPLLNHAIRNDKLFPVSRIMWSFVRPRKPADRVLAYAQSYWFCRFIEEKWGHEAILDLMRQFKEGRPQNKAFAAVLKLSENDFDKQFAQWARKQIDGWGYDQESSSRYAELAKKGEELLKARNDQEAVKVWEELAALRPMDPLPAQRLATLYLGKTVHDPRKAMENLDRLHRASLRDNRFAKRLARLCMTELGDPAAAERYALEAIHIDTYDLDAHELMKEICEKTGNRAWLDRENRVIPRLKNWWAEYEKGVMIDQ